MAPRAPAPIRLQVHRSRQLQFYLLAVHGLAALSLTLMRLPLILQIIGVLLVGISLFWQWMRHGAAFGSWRITQVYWQSDGTWLVTDGAGRDRHYLEYEQVLTNPALILVHLRGTSGDHWLVLARDSADAEPLRQLRVRLRRQQGQARDHSEPLAGR